MRALFPSITPGGLLLAAALLTNPNSAQAQILQQWSLASAFGESSAVVGMDGGYMLVVDNEDEVLRLYPRYPETACAGPIVSYDMRPQLSPTSSNQEADVEAAVKTVDANGTRIYWLGSHSNSKSGNARPNRNRLFATAVSGDGTGPVPYSLSFVGRYDQLRTDLIAWDQNNQHGKGANYYGLAASATVGVIPTRIDGFNIEGLALAPDGVTAYIAFRAPLVNGSGATTSIEQRTNALIVPLLNLSALVTGRPTAGPGAARFGDPFTLNLGARGIRSLDSSYPGHYLITAGPTGDTSNPPAAPYDFRLFTWSGSPEASPNEQVTEFPFGCSPEGAILPAEPITGHTIAQFVSDGDGGTCWQSVTALVAPNTAQPQAPPTVRATQSRAGTLQLTIQGDSSREFRIEATVNMRDWVTVLVVQSPTMPLTWSDPDAAQFSARFYRVVYRP